MYKLFSIAGYDKNQVDEKFSGMINALSYGAPPHGGIAPGIDRIVMLLANEKNIREVTMFPMNQNAQDLMMNAPSEVNPDQLKELNLALKMIPELMSSDARLGISGSLIELNQIFEKKNANEKPNKTKILKIQKNK